MTAGRAVTASRRRALAALLLLAALPAAAPIARADPLTDAAGRPVAMPRRVARALAAGPPASVLLYTLAPDLMAGWVAAPRPEALPYLEPRVHDLPAYGRLTGRGGTANVEAMLAARPDLILDVGSLGATYASLADRVQAQTGIPYALLDGAFPAIPATYRRLGALLGRQSDAEALAAAADAITGTVAARVAELPAERRPRVYYARGPRGLETAPAGSLSAELIEAAGGRNVVPAGGAGLTNVSVEQVLAWDPEEIVALDPGFAAAIAADPLWRGLRAVREGRVHAVPLQPFPWFDAPPGVNRLIGLRWLAGLLHPNLFPEPMGDAVRDFYWRFYHVDLDAAGAAALLSTPAGAAR